MKILFIMDDIRHLDYPSDTSLGLMLAAQQQNWEVYYCQPHQLSINQGEAYGLISEVKVYTNADHYFNANPPYWQALTDMDMIIMRKDPPVDAHYWHATQILDLAVQAGCLVINRPQSLRDFNEKIFATHFAKISPETLVSADKDQLWQFIQTFSEVVVKPLDGMGGRGIFRLEKSDGNILSALEMLTERWQQPIICQRYLPEIKSGDKRILMINGEPLPYALVRTALPNENRANLAAGGTFAGQELTERDRLICTSVGPTLIKHGLYLVGLDVIGDYLTEINITSPTCARELSEIYQHDFCMDIFLALKKIALQSQKKL